MELDLSWAKIWLNTLKTDSKSHSYYYGYVIEQEEIERSLETLHELVVYILYFHSNNLSTAHGQTSLGLKKKEDTFLAIMLIIGFDAILPYEPFISLVRDSNSFRCSKKSIMYACQFVKILL